MNSGAFKRYFYHSFYMKQPLAFLRSVTIPVCFSCHGKGSSKADGLVTRAGEHRRERARVDGARPGRARHLAAAGGGSALPVFGPGRKREFLSLAVSRGKEMALKRCFHTGECVSYSAIKGRPGGKPGDLQAAVAPCGF